MSKRINKLLAAIGIASRRKIDWMIEKKKILVNGRPAKLGMSINPEKDKVEINGKLILFPEEQKKIYIMMNKPPGVVSTVSDPNNRPTVVGLVKKMGINVRVFPVGRLDVESEGLILLTNDGDLTNKLTHPRFHIQKKYLIKVKGKLTSRAILRFRTGVPLKDGRTKRTETEIIKREDGLSTLEITLKEGRNRQIRRMCVALNLEVIELKRLSIGGLELGDLDVGKFRRLGIKEVKNMLSGKM